jgi:simple sugar transport system permease protein
MLIAVLAVALGLAVGAVVILAAGADPVVAMTALVEGAFFTPHGLTESVVASIPLIILGTAVAIGFRAGLFNIGAEGQFYLGALFGTFVGYQIPAPPGVHLLLAIGAAFLGGAIWGGIPGLLKARFGAHEVITTIMMNFIAFGLTNYLVTGAMRGRGSSPKTPNILSTAELPRLFASPDRLHVGMFIALAVAAFGYWLLFRTPFGYEIRTVGLNPDAARAAGMRVPRTIVSVLALSGGLSGVAGAIEVLGLAHYLPSSFSGGYGFDAIAVALLAQSHPIAVIPAAFLFGVLATGSGLMQLRSGVNPTVVSIIQAVVIMLVAAPAIIRLLFRIPVSTERVVIVRETEGV